VNGFKHFYLRLNPSPPPFSKGGVLSSLDEGKGGGLKNQHGCNNASDEEADGSNPTADCKLKVPLIPWPLVQPPAQRAPIPRMIPPMSATTHRRTGV